MISPKTMTMCILLAFMAILWGRVLLKGKNAPASANAQEALESQQQMLSATQSTARLEIEPVELPVLAGRHDTLSHDMFRIENGTAFGLQARGVVEIDVSGESPESANRAKLERIAQRLVLEAVVQDAQGQPFQAFIDGKILSVGSTLTVKEGPDPYVLTLDKINEKEVLFSWNKISVVIKMAETFEL